MPRPIPVPVRHAVRRRLLDGQEGPTIAAARGLAPRTVRQLIRRFRQGGQDAVRPSYDGCGAATPKPSEARVPAALGRRRAHPTWGAGLIRVMLRRHAPHLDPPATRTLQRWFLRAGLAPAPAGRRPAADTRRAARPHEVGRWTRLSRCHSGPASESLGYGSPTSAVAECSGPRFSPRGPWSEVPPQDVQAQMRLAFTPWGRPERLRVDNGAPWGSAGDLPTDLALWLIGLGVAVDWNPPRRPQDNGVVEQSQGTAKRWAEPSACVSAGELQRRLEEMDDVQRREYPSVRGRSRLETFPNLVHSGRAYSRAWERKHWSLAAVTAHLAGYAARRRVDRCGLVSLYNRNHYVGVIHRGDDLFIMFDPECLEWIIADAEGRQLRRQPGDEICRERIIGLTVTNRRRRTGGQ